MRDKTQGWHPHLPSQQGVGHSQEGSRERISPAESSPALYNDLIKPELFFPLVTLIISLIFHQFSLCSAYSPFLSFIITLIQTSFFFFLPPVVLCQNNLEKNILMLKISWGHYERSEHLKSHCIGYIVCYIYFLLLYLKYLKSKKCLHYKRFDYGSIQVLCKLQLYGAAPVSNGSKVHYSLCITMLTVYDSKCID